MSGVDTDSDPPGGLSEYTKRWWRAVCKEYEVREVDLASLELAADALDRYRAAKADLEENGLYREGSKGQSVQAPAVFIARESLKEYVSLCRLLGVDKDGA